jgi:hypothetical protein
MPTNSAMGCNPTALGGRFRQLLAAQVEIKLQNCQRPEKPSAHLSARVKTLFPGARPSLISNCRIQASLAAATRVLPAGKFWPPTVANKLGFGAYSSAA